MGNKQSLPLRGKSIGILFSKNFEGEAPLGHVGVKLPVYLRLLELIQKKGYRAYVLTRKTYVGQGTFNGVWKFDIEDGYSNGKFIKINKETKMDLVYDRSAGVKFPPENDDAIWVNNRNFKVLAWDKWAAYKVIGEYMPKTFLVKDESEIKSTISKIKTDIVVLKPFNGLKGIGIYIGDKKEARYFKFNEKYKPYVAQEFVDTSKGIPKITSGRHDLRIVVVNGKVVWCHVRVPKEGTFLANAAQGGNLTEVDYKLVPNTVKKIVKKVAKIFTKEYDNPLYSLDFGIDKTGTPKIFEMNDQMGFPKQDMKNRDTFLMELVKNFKVKLEILKRIQNNI